MHYACFHCSASQPASPDGGAPCGSSSVGCKLYTDAVRCVTEARATDHGQPEAFASIYFCFLLHVPTYSPGFRRAWSSVEYGSVVIMVPAGTRPEKGQCASSVNKALV